jgi:hypothetical protein
MTKWDEGVDLAATVDAQLIAEKDQPNGYPSLDANGNISQGTADDQINTALIPIKQRLSALEGSQGGGQAAIRLGSYPSGLSMSAFESLIGGGWVSPSTWVFPAFDTTLSSQGYASLVGTGRRKLLVNIPIRLASGKFATWAGLSAGNYIATDGSGQIGANGAADTQLATSLAYLETLAVAHPETEIIIVCNQEPDVSWRQSPGGAGATGTPAQFKTYFAHFASVKASNAPTCKLAFVMGNGTRTSSDTGGVSPGDATGWWPSASVAAIDYVGFDPYNNNTPWTTLAGLMGRDGQALFGKGKPCIVTSGCVEAGDDGTKKGQWFTDALALSLDGTQFPTVTDVIYWNGSSPGGSNAVDTTAKALSGAQLMFQGNENPPVVSATDWNEIKGAITATDSITDGTGNITTTTLVVAKALPVGAFVLVFGGSNSNPTLSSVSDNSAGGPNSWTIDKQKATTGTAKGSVWAARTILTHALAPGDHITLVQSVANAVRWGAGIAGTGIASVSTLDTSASAESTGAQTNPNSGVGGTTSQTNILVAGATVFRSGLVDVLIASDDGLGHLMTSIDHRGPVTSAGASANFAAGYVVLTGTETPAATFNSHTNAAQWGAIMVAYKIVMDSGGGSSGSELTANKDQPGGYPSLDSGGLVPTAEIPFITKVLSEDHAGSGVITLPDTADHTLFSFASMPYVSGSRFFFQAAGIIQIANSGTARTLHWKFKIGGTQIGEAGLSIAVVTGAAKSNVKWRVQGFLIFRDATHVMIDGLLTHLVGASASHLTLMNGGTPSQAVSASPQTFELDLSSDTNGGLGDTITCEDWEVEKVK